MTHKSVSIASRAALSFDHIILCICVLGCFTLLQMSSMYEHSSKMAGKWMPSLNELNDVSQYILRPRTSTLRFLFSEDTPLTLKGLTNMSHNFCAGRALSHRDRGLNRASEIFGDRPYSRIYEIFPRVTQLTPYRLTSS